MSDTPSKKEQLEIKMPLVTVGALVKGSSERVLIAKTSKWSGLWGVPGGKVDWNEALEAALVREFREEVGLELTNIRFALVQEAIVDPQFYKEAHFVLFNYYAVSATENVTPNEEILEWEWVTPLEALQYPLNTYTRILIEQYIKDTNANT